MERKRRAIASSVGSKATMAVTGLLLVGFVIAHMLGNLQVFAGPEQINAYARKLKDLGPLLWAMRIGLLAVFVVHVAAAAGYRLSAGTAGAAVSPIKPSAYAAVTATWVSGDSRAVTRMGTASAPALLSQWAA